MITQNSIIIIFSGIKKIFPKLPPHIMQLIFQNSKDNKQTRQFVKSLKYVYNSMIQKQKNVYLYISIDYIAVISNFLDTSITDYRVCFCKLKKNMYKLKNFFINNQPQEKQGIIFKIDIVKMINILNSQIQSLINQLTLIFPTPDSQKQDKMVLTYLSDKLKLVSQMWVQKQSTAWPFKDGTGFQQFLPNSNIVNFMILPSTFIQQIAYAKKFINFWICLSINGINIKQTKDGYISFDHFISKDNFGQYDFVNLKEVLKQNVIFCVRRDLLFHHLSFAKKQGKKTYVKVAVQFEVYETDRYIKNCYLYLTTISDKKQIHEMFEIAAKSSLQSQQDRTVSQPRFKLRLKQMKKEQAMGDEMVLLNRYYSPEYQDVMRFDRMRRDGLIKEMVQQSEEQPHNHKKYKVQL